MKDEMNDAQWERYFARKLKECGNTIEIVRRYERRIEELSEMSKESVGYWAEKAAYYYRKLKESKRRIEELSALLRESRRSHYHCDDSWFCCGKCDAIDHEGTDGLTGHAGGDGPDRTMGECNCGADAWNARVDAALGAPAGAERPRDPSVTPSKQGT